MSVSNNWIEETRQRFPAMFANTHPFNFECGIGWKSIINDLCEQILAIEPTVTVAQIKEKFGTLRFYIGACPNETYEQVHKLIRTAEAISGVTCEDCGQPGTPQKGGWLRTLCDGCAERHRSRP